MIRRWLRKRRKQRACFHHEQGGVLDNGARPAESWIEQQLVDLGRRKIFWCTKCEKTWIT